MFTPGIISFHVIIPGSLLSKTKELPVGFTNALPDTVTFPVAIVNAFPVGKTLAAAVTVIVPIPKVVGFPVTLKLAAPEILKAPNPKGYLTSYSIFNNRISNNTNTTNCYV
jgi:hypothetical protein